MDQDLCLVWLYGVIDGVLRSIGRVRQRGPAPELTDAEVLTIQLWGEIWGLPNDASVWRDAPTNLHGWFPNLCNEWNFVRRCGSLAKVMDFTGVAVRTDEGLERLRRSAPAGLPQYPRGA